MPSANPPRRSVGRESDAAYDRQCSKPQRDEVAMFGRGIGAPEIILILLVVILLFGAKKLPDLARGVGRSLRIFKAETKGLSEDDNVDNVDKADSPTPPAPLQVEAGRGDVPTPPVNNPVGDVTDSPRRDV